MTTNKVSTTLDDLDSLSFPSAYQRYGVQESTATDTPTPAPISSITKLDPHQAEYKSGSRNPVADLIRKPERDLAKEERLRKVAKWSAIGDAIGLIGKGYAASRGARVIQTEGVATNNALNELNRLDEVYKQEGYKYDQTMLMDAIRQEDNAVRSQQAAQTRADQYNFYEQQRTDRANDREQSRLDRLEDQKASIKEQERREAVTQKAADDNFKRQMMLVNASSKSSANKSQRSSAGGRADGSVLHAGNIPMAYTDPTTGKVTNIPDGDFAVLLREAMNFDPGLKTRLNNHGTGEDDKHLWKREAMDGVANYLKNGQTFRKAVEIFKQSGDLEMPILEFHKETNGAFRAYSNDQLRAMFGKAGINLTKTNK